MRAKKCDRTHPECQRCMKSGFNCAGYEQLEDLHTKPFLREPLDPLPIVVSSLGPEHCFDFDVNLSDPLQLDQKAQSPIYSEADDSGTPLSSTYSAAYSSDNPPSEIRRKTSPPSETSSLVSAEPTNNCGLPFRALALSNKERNVNSSVPQSRSRYQHMLPLVSAESREVFRLFMFSSTDERIVSTSCFRPTHDQTASIHGAIIWRLQHSPTSSWSILLGAKIFEAVAETPERGSQRLEKYYHWIERFEKVMDTTLPGSLCSSTVLSDCLEIAVLKLRTTKRINTYQLLRDQAPRFLQIIFSDSEFWTDNHGSMNISLARVLSSYRYEIIHFSLLDVVCSMAYGLPQVVDYDTSTLPFNRDTHHPAEWVHGCPIELQICLAKINALCSWSLMGPMPDWRPIEQELHEWKPFTRTALEEESWRGVVRLAVQESWRHTLLIYLYMGVCGVASDGPRVRASVKQVFQIIGAVKKESDPIGNIHFANQYLIAGAYTPSEKRRAIVREELSKLIKTGMWLLSGSDFVPVLDHLWHNAGCNGQPVTWRDYVHSRQIALPVPK
ncbi:Fungal specific transcription factor domain [Ceratobasidium sp. AG-Ba]|nr:Fungal specific transcription factor domain [Ceratobasidium sp. AG-Ba]